MFFYVRARLGFANGTIQDITFTARAPSIESLKTS
jgi:hypothetical protein